MFHSLRRFNKKNKKKDDPEDPELRGISVDYITKQLMKEVIDAGLGASSKIYELEVCRN